MSPQELASLHLEKFKAVVPSPEYADQMTDFVNELRRENRMSRTSNTWLKDIEIEFSRRPGGSENMKGVKLLVRTNDNYVVGLHCVRDEKDMSKLEGLGGNISYLIRPSERRKGYNKINMYLALKECVYSGMHSIVLICENDNKAAARSIKAMGGRLTKEYYDRNDTGIRYEEYIVNVADAIASYAPIFEFMIER